MLSYWLWMALLALLFWGITGVTQKLSTNNISARISFLWFAVAFVPIALVVVVTQNLVWDYSWGLIFAAGIGGALNGLGALTVFVALERGGKASIVIPLVALYPLVTVILAFVFMAERLTGIQWLGVALAVMGAALLSRE